MSQKVLVFGAGGWLARKYVDTFGNTSVAVADIADAREAASVLDKAKPEVVINAAGKTGRPNIDWCEENRWETFRSNVIGAAVLASACAKRGIYLVHLSSGCIFDGPSPGPDGWTEEDMPNPVSYYGVTKVQAERHLVREPGRCLVIRLRMPVDREPGPRNLITKLVGYPKVIDVVNSVTVVDDLIIATASLIAQRATGIFNVVNPGPIGHREILEGYRQLVDPRHRFEMIPLEEMYQQGLAKAGRSNCVLSTAKLSAHGINLPPASDAVMQCLEAYGKLLGVGA